MSTTQRLSPASFVKLSADVASFYGFAPLRDIEQELPQRRGRAQHTFASSMEVCAQRLAQKTTDPILTYWANIGPSHLPQNVSPREIGEFGLHVAGANESMGEIVLLKTLYAILSEWGAGVVRVRLNALGDRDSKLRFEKELTSYLRKHAVMLDPVVRKSVGENPLSAYSVADETCRQILADGPHAMNFLSEKSRSHFREVLEYIESLGLPYEVDDLLVGDDRDPRIVFALDLADEDSTVVCSQGGRYDEYVRRFGTRKDGTAVSASIFFRKGTLGASSVAASAPARTPSLYLIQLGTRAKLQGLGVLDMLRAAQIPVLHSFDCRSLAPQLENAQKNNASYLLIMGQREAIDNTIIVRSMRNNSQQVVPLAGLPRYLKALKV